MQELQTTSDSAFAQISVLISMVWTYLCCIMGIKVDSKKEAEPIEQIQAPAPAPVGKETAAAAAAAAAIKARKHLSQFEKGVHIPRARCQVNYSATKRIKP